MNKKNIHDRRNAVIDLYSEGRSQQEIARRLKISQATVHRDIQFERENQEQKSDILR
jgi:DNA-binding NarL/FixJ family response regulator